MLYDKSRLPQVGRATFMRAAGSVRQSFAGGFRSSDNQKGAHWGAVRFSSVAEVSQASYRPSEAS